MAREKVNWPKGPREAGLGRDLGARITLSASRRPRPTWSAPFVGAGVPTGPLRWARVGAPSPAPLGSRGGPIGPWAAKGRPYGDVGPLWSVGADLRVRPPVLGAHIGAPLRRRAGSSRPTGAHFPTPPPLGEVPPKGAEGAFTGPPSVSPYGSTASLPLLSRFARHFPLTGGIGPHRGRQKAGAHCAPLQKGDSLLVRPLIRHGLRPCHLPPRGKVRRVQEAAPYMVRTIRRRRCPHRPAGGQRPPLRQFRSAPKKFSIFNSQFPIHFSFCIPAFCIFI